MENSEIRKTRQTEILFEERGATWSRLRSYPVRLRTGRDNSGDHRRPRKKRERTKKYRKIVETRIEMSQDVSKYSIDSDHNV